MTHLARTIAPVAIAFCLTASSAFSGGHALTPEIVAAIEAKLKDMQCQMDPDDIEVEEDGYELDDVICIGGDQFDITLDTDLNETARRAE